MTPISAALQGLSLGHPTTFLNLTLLPPQPEAAGSDPKLPMRSEATKPGPWEHPGVGLSCLSGLLRSGV